MPLLLYSIYTVALQIGQADVGENTKYIEARFDALVAKILFVQQKSEANVANIEQRFHDNKTALDAALQSANDDARRVALATERRFESVNEFRRTLADQAATFIHRSEAVAIDESLQRETDLLRIALAKFSASAESADKAGAVERAQLDKRLDSMNEFRAQLKDQAGTFITRNEFVAELKPNFILLGIATTAIIAIVTAGWMLVGLRIESANTALIIQVGEIKLELARLKGDK